jgi:hypothetical protein
LASAALAHGAANQSRADCADCHMAAEECDCWNEDEDDDDDDDDEGDAGDADDADEEAAGGSRMSASTPSSIPSGSAYARRAVAMVTGDDDDDEDDEDEVTGNAAWHSPHSSIKSCISGCVEKERR